MLSITSGVGFHLKFANGWVVSVQFGYGHHSSNRNNPDAHRGAGARGWLTADTAEVAAFDAATGEWYRPEGWCDDVKGYLPADEVAAFIAEVKALPPFSATNGKEKA